MSRYVKKTNKQYDKRFDREVWQPLMQFARNLPMEQQLQIVRGEYESPYKRR